MFSRVPDREEFIMSIAQGTTHYDYPQVQLTDRPTFADFNPAFSDIDAKLYGLITGAAADEQLITDLGLAVSELRTNLNGVSDVANTAKAKADANEEVIGLLSTEVSQNTTRLGTKIDSNAIAEPYDTSATYAVGDVVTYQGQRYRCITAVAVAEPFDATKWTGEDVETVLERLGSPDAEDVTLSPITGMIATDVQAGIDELNNNLTNSGKFDNAISLNSYTSSDNKYTFPKNGYLYGVGGSSDGGALLSSSDSSNSFAMAVGLKANESVIIPVYTGMRFYISINVADINFRFIGLGNN